MQEHFKSEILNVGREDCSNLHFWGPGVRSCYVLHYIIKGAGVFTRSGKTYSVDAGQSFLIAPYEEIAYYPKPDDPWEYIWVDFSGGQYKRLLEKIFFLTDSCIIDRIAAEKILPYFQMLRDAPLAGCTAEGLLHTVLGVYADSYPSAAQNTGESSYFSQAVQLIHSFYHRPEFGVPALCSRIQISRVTLHRCFKAGCGISPGAYLQGYRIDRARELLARGMSIKSVAVSCGFNDPLYFSKVFSGAVGMSPRAYSRGTEPEK